VLLLVGCYWLAEGARLNERAAVPMISVAALLVAFCWRHRNRIVKSSST
jgi:hypothetical protein